MPEAAKRAARAAALRREVLERLIDDELILQQATELKLTVTSEQVDSSIEEIKRQNNIDDDQLREALRAAGDEHGRLPRRPEEAAAALPRASTSPSARGSRSPTTTSRAYYDRHMKDGANVQVRASHIFIAIPENADAGGGRREAGPGQEAARPRARRRGLRQAGARGSDDPATRAEGGDLGYFGKDMLPKPIEEMVFAMKVGEVRGPVRADRGFHVIKLVDRKTKDPKPLDEVKDDVRMQLRQKEMERQTKSTWPSCARRRWSTSATDPAVGHPPRRSAARRRDPGLLAAAAVFTF